MQNRPLLRSCVMLLLLPSDVLVHVVSLDAQSLVPAILAVCSGLRGWAGENAEVLQTLELRAIAAERWGVGFERVVLPPALVSEAVRSGVALQEFIPPWPSCLVGPGQRALRVALSSRGKPKTAAWTGSLGGDRALVGNYPFPSTRAPCRYPFLAPQVVDSVGEVAAKEDLAMGHAAAKQAGSASRGARGERPSQEAAEVYTDVGLRLDEIQAGDDNACAAVAAVPSDIAYFEVTIHPAPVPADGQRARSVASCVSVGLVDGAFDLAGRQAGWQRGGIGYHSDDGHLFCGKSSSSHRFGPRFGPGDTVGCAVIYAPCTEPAVAAPAASAGAEECTPAQRAHRLKLAMATLDGTLRYPTAHPLRSWTTGVEQVAADAVRQGAVAAGSPDTSQSPDLSRQFGWEGVIERRRWRRPRDRRTAHLAAHRAFANLGSPYDLEALLMTLGEQSGDSGEELDSEATEGDEDTEFEDEDEEEGEEEEDEEDEEEEETDSSEEGMTNMEWDGDTEGEGEGEGKDGEGEAGERSGGLAEEHHEAGGNEREEAGDLDRDNSIGSVPGTVSEAQVGVAVRSDAGVEQQPQPQQPQQPQQQPGQSRTSGQPLAGTHGSSVAGAAGAAAEAASTAAMQSDRESTQRACDQSAIAGIARFLDFLLHSRRDVLHRGADQPEDTRASLMRVASAVVRRLQEHHFIEQGRRSLLPDARTEGAQQRAFPNPAYAPTGLRSLFQVLCNTRIRLADAHSPFATRAVHLQASHEPTALAPTSLCLAMSDPDDCDMPCERAMRLLAEAQASGELETLCGCAHFMTVLTATPLALLPHWAPPPSFRAHLLSCVPRIPMCSAAGRRVVANAICEATGTCAPLYAAYAVFTLNGQIVGTPVRLYRSAPLYPTVGLDSWSPVSVNFGTSKPFLCSPARIRDAVAALPGLRGLSGVITSPTAAVQAMAAYPRDARLRAHWRAEARLYSQPRVQPRASRWSSRAARAALQQRMGAEVPALLLFEDPRFRDASRLATKLVLSVLQLAHMLQCLHAPRGLSETALGHLLVLREVAEYLRGATAPSDAATGATDGDADRAPAARTDCAGTCATQVRLQQELVRLLPALDELLRCLADLPSALEETRAAARQQMRVLALLLDRPHSHAQSAPGIGRDFTRSVDAFTVVESMLEADAPGEDRLGDEPPPRGLLQRIGAVAALATPAVSNAIG